jgi:hypothetical protein
MDSDLIETHLIKCLSRAQDMDIFEEDSYLEEKTNQITEEEKLTNLFQNLQNPEKRQEALLELSLMEDTCKDLAVHIFYSSTTLAIL